MSNEKRNLSEFVHEKNVLDRRDALQIALQNGGLVSRLLVGACLHMVGRRCELVHKPVVERAILTVKCRLIERVVQWWPCARVLAHAHTSPIL